MSNDMGDWLSELQDMNPDMIEEDSTTKKGYKLDLFKQVLPAIDRKNKFYYRSLTPEEQSSIEPWILMRWMTSCSDNDQPHYLITVNDFLNNNFDCLVEKKTKGITGHKELQWMLLCLCATGKSIKRQFMKPGKGAVKNRLEEALLSFFPLLKDSDLELLIKINTQEDFEKFFRDNGYDDKTISEIFKK